MHPHPKTKAETPKDHHGLSDNSAEYQSFLFYS